MLKNLLTALIVILPVALVSGGLTYWRVGPLTEEKTDEAALKGPEVSAITLAFAAIAFSIIFGLITTVLYTWMAGRWPGTAFNIYLGLAIGLTILFNIAAVIVRTAAKMGGIPECIVLNTAIGIGYGWLLPLLINR